MRHNFHFQEFR